MLHSNEAVQQNINASLGERIMNHVSQRTSVLILANSAWRSEKAVISVGHTNVKSNG